VRLELQVRRRPALLDAVAAYLPSPLDRPPVVGHHPKKGTEITAGRPRRAVLRPGLQDHQRRPRRPVVRPHLFGPPQGREPGLQPRQGQEGELLRLYHIRADDREKVEEAAAGDIVGVVGLKDSVTGDTLCDAAHPLLLEKIEFPETVISMSIEPVSSADKGKLSDTLAPWRAKTRRSPTRSTRRPARP
jgi:elongation factor G